MPGADVYVDGNRIGEIGSAVIKDRKIMANDGILVVIVNVNMKKKRTINQTKHYNKRICFSK